TVPFEQLPKQRNPARGFIATANNKMVAQNRGIYFGNAWEPDSRIQRITELLTTKEKFGVEDFERMHIDVQSYHAKKMLMHINPILKRASLSEKERHIQKLLESWDCNESWESVQATIYNMMFVHLLKNSLEDECGSEILNEFLYWTNFPIRAMENLITMPASDWWDDKSTTQRENLDMIVVKSFRNTIQELQNEMGEGPGFWEWGLLHQITFTHPLGQQAPMDRIFNDGPYPIGGSANSIAKAEFDFTQPYRVDAGASMRQIVDLANPDRALSVIAGGQSGQPFSDHYSDQAQLWVDGKYKIVRMARSEIEQSATSMQIFRPKE
ncbi:MAG: penicillin acylase family protein, partial [bacterium]